MRRKKLLTPLPPLGFGGRSGKVDDSVYEMRDRLQFVTPGLLECEALADHGFFQHQSSLLNLNGMKIAATASTPVRERFGNNTDLTLIIPLTGQGHMIVEGRMIHWQAGVSGMLLPSASCSGESTLRSILMIDVNEKKLRQTATRMHGHEETVLNELKLHEARKLNLHIGRISFDTIFRQLGNLLNQFLLEPGMMNHAGLEDNIYRNLVILLQPELFLSSNNPTPSSKYSRRLLDRVCDYAQSHLSQSITMTELERVSNMSARSLHYGFLKRYGMTPMQWVRSERLIMARNYLTSSPPGSTVTAIAFSCGFNKPATFAVYYFKHFGELPSATLSQAQAR